MTRPILSVSEKETPAIARYAGRTLHWKGKEHLYFSGTNYLGTSTDAQLQRVIKTSFETYGAHVSVTRVSPLRFGAYAEAERRLAQWMDTEAALLFSSGFVACQLLLKTLKEVQRHIHYLPFAHPAHWESRTDERLCALPEEGVSGQQSAFIGNPIDHLTLEEMPLFWTKTLHKNALVVLDDSHLLGIRGPKGAGSLHLLPDHIRRFSVGSLGKGLGIPAGWLAGNKKELEQVQKSPFYGGASMPNLAFVEGLMYVLEQLPQLKRRLLDNIQLFVKTLKQDNTLSMFHFLPDYPIFGTSHHRLATHLEKHHILVSSFSYPSPDSPKRTRIVLSAAHTPEDILRLCRAIKLFLPEDPA